MSNNCKSPEMCMLSETCIPCAICPNAKEKANDRLARTTCSALEILQGCGLHGGYYNTIEKAAEGVRDIIRSLRADLHDPPHDIQCAVLRKLGVEGFTKEGVAATHQLITLPNDEHVHHYQRERASITGLGLKSGEIIVTERLVVVARCGLFGL